MIKRSQVQTQYRLDDGGNCVVDGSFMAEGSYYLEKHEKNIDEARERARDECMQYLYGDILRKLSRLYGELPFAVRDAACMSHQQAAEVTAKKIQNVITEIKAELEMR